jgi:DeoR family transcriptional regulator of aga operon
MIASARRVVVVADGSKVGRSLLAHIVAAADIDELVTDSSADRTELAALEARGVKVTIADATDH